MMFFGKATRVKRDGAVFLLAWDIVCAVISVTGNTGRECKALFNPSHTEFLSVDYVARCT